MKRIAGYTLLVAIFGTLFLGVVNSVGLYAAILTWAIAAGLAGLLLVAVMLIT